MFDDLDIVDLVFIGLVLCEPRFIILLCFFSPGFNLIFSVLAKRLAGTSISGMTYLVSSWTLNLNAVN